MKCPRCSKSFETVEVDGIELDVCVSCKGTWFDNDELRQAKDMGEPDANWLDFDIWKQRDRFAINTSDIKCPRCDKPLHALSYDKTKVRIDVCPTCQGVWLDDAELRQIIEALQDEINSKTFAEYVPAAIQQAIELLSGPESLVSEWNDLKNVLRLMRLRLFVEKPQIF